MSRTLRKVGTTLLLAAGLAQARDPAADEHAILRVEAALCHAFETGDAESLRRQLDPGFTLTDSKGQVSDFAQNIDEVARREPSYELFRNHDQKIRLYGDAAIVTGITTIKGHSGANAFAGNFQYTDTWLRHGKQWILAASHASRLPE
ncbi:MAG: nuclear transport factor 2 family protein [Dokdonella sp.]